MIIVGIFNSCFSVVDSNTKLKTNKNIEELNNTINNLIEYSTPCSIKKKTINTLWVSSKFKSFPSKVVISKRNRQATHQETICKSCI